RRPARAGREDDRPAAGPHGEREWLGVHALLADPEAAVRARAGHAAPAGVLRRPAVAALGEVDRFGEAARAWRDAGAAARRPDDRANGHQDPRRKSLGVRTTCRRRAWPGSNGSYGVTGARRFLLPIAAADSSRRPARIRRH